MASNDAACNCAMFQLRLTLSFILALYTCHNVSEKNNISLVYTLYILQICYKIGELFRDNILKCNAV